jgi:hypothetical protein
LSEFEFEILAGLPASGPLALPFPPNSLGFREGLVVKVRCSSAEEWVGNFRYGENDHSAVYKHPDGKRLIVVAGGQDYLVDPLTKECLRQTTDNISFSREIPELSAIVFGDHIRFWAEGVDGGIWITPRLSWDSFTEISVTGNILAAKWYSVIDEEWHDFSLDLSSGEVIGETYEADLRHVRPISRS